MLKGFTLHAAINMAPFPKYSSSLPEFLNQIQANGQHHTAQNLRNSETCVPFSTATQLTHPEIFSADRV
jgi:hypothetical protein